MFVLPFFWCACSWTDLSFQVCWRPRPTSNASSSDPLCSVPTPHASAVAYLGTVKTPSKPAGAYRPPGARGQVTPLHFKREDEGGAAHVSNGVLPFATNAVHNFEKHKRREIPGSQAALPPGAAPGGGVSLTGAADTDENLSKAALKNKKKREAKKAKEAAAAGSSIASSTGDVEDGTRKNDLSPERKGRKSHSRNLSRNDLQPRSQSRPQRRERSNHRSGKSPWRERENEKVASANHATSLPVSNPSVSILTNTDEAPLEDSTVTSPSGGTLEQKKLRGLLKKLRAIDDLKMRLAGGEKLEDTQMKKIGSEDAVRKELEESGWEG